MKCDECEQENAYLIPLRAVNDKEVRDLRLCPECFEIYRDPHSDKHSQYNRMSYPQFFEGCCKACGSKTNYLREVSLNLANEHRDMLLCQSCYRELLLLQEKGNLSDFPYISGLT